MKLPDTDTFIKRAIEVHGDFYNYDKVVYVGCHKKVIITHPIYGDFEQTPANHTSKLKRGGSIRAAVDKTDWIKNMFIDVHGDKYGYDEVKYVNGRTKVKIYCKVHKEYFFQLPNAHVDGAGCKKCGNERSSVLQGKNSLGWSHTNWIEMADKSKWFDSYKVYIIKCFNEDEEFYKVGKTFNKMWKRFPNKDRMPYNYEVVKIYESLTDGVMISKLEESLKNKYKQSRYIPKMKFNGMNECFIMNDDTPLR